MTDTTIYCAQCEEQVTLRRGENNGLRIACACSTRSLKVARVLPQEWQENA